MFRYSNCFPSSVTTDGKDGHRFNLKFQWYACKNHEKILWFDIFITLQDIYGWANALSNDLSIKLT